VSKHLSIRARLFLLAPLVIGSSLVISEGVDDKAGVGPAQPKALKTTEYPVPRPPFSPGIFPCSQCHNKDLPTNRTQRKLEVAHDEIQLHHGKNLWCLDCHNADNRDTLRSASGTPISFDESYKLCGQCHGEKYRDWKVGVHGKRTGEWNGPKQYLLCVNCHNPHSPKFKKMAPLPPPVRPEDIGRGNL
jgi:formate-dependent nitrite reductase cytochrome c552 subunit